MWLLNIVTRKLECFQGSTKPVYVILSHRWEEEEVTFQEIQAGQGKHKQGYRKIDLCCRQAQLEKGIFDHHYPWLSRGTPTHAWIDTCCIDKTNSAELSEAINSMYQWYKEARFCYAFLSDMVDTNGANDVGNSSWFSRGWTLQELLAPYAVNFYDRHWNSLGDKRSLQKVISEATGIPVTALESYNPNAHCAGEIMSWAALRSTTRLEDQAYCLLGLFDVHMPLIYGEGSRAFYRLQQEICRARDDLTLFAYTEIRGSGIFASDPECFGTGKSFEAYKPGTVRKHTSNFETQSNGITSSTGLTLILDLIPVFYDTYIAPLCWVRDNLVCPQNQTLKGMLLRRHTDGLFRRYFFLYECLFDVPDHHGPWGRKSRQVTLARGELVGWYGGSLLMAPQSLIGQFNQDTYGFNVKIDSVQGDFDFFSKEAAGKGKLSIGAGSSGIVGMVRCRTSSLSLTFYIFGYDFDFHPFCLIVRPSKCYGRSWEPPNTLITVPRLRFHNFVLGSSTDMLALANALEAHKEQTWSVVDDGVEFHAVSRRDERTVFKVSSGGQVAFNAADTFTEVEINTFQSVTTIPQSSGVVDTWHHQSYIHE